MKELVNFIEKGKQEKFLELFMILTELNHLLMINTI